MITVQKHKTFSEFTQKELEEDSQKIVEELGEEGLEVFKYMMMDGEFEAAVVANEYDRDVVDVKTWLEDDYYMGNFGKSLYAPWKEDLIELFENGVYDQAIIVGSIGSGKSTFSHLAVIRMLYEASCLTNPAVSYGLAPGSTIGFCNLATSKETARRVVFEGIVAKLKDSPYFKHEFPPLKEVKQEILFPKGLGLIAGSSTDTSIIGMNIFGGIIDEGNFMRSGMSAASVRAQGASFERWGHYSRAGRLYDAVVRRMKSRYMKRGKLPGILIVASSKTTHDSFTEKLIRNAQAEGSMSMFVRDRNIIEVKREFFSKETFKVLVGNEQYRSKILAPGEDISKYGEDIVIVDIPEDLRKDFESDLESSLRDLAGVSTVGISSFIGNVEKIEEMIVHDRVHPFVSPICDNPLEWDSIAPYTISWEKIAKRKDDGSWVPLLNPQAKRHVSMDPALTGDAFGLCIAHVSGMREMSRTDVGQGVVTENQPEVTIDLILRIKANIGEEIQFRNVRKIIYEFTEHGFHIAKITTDTYQSREMLQTLTQQGYNAELLSVDISKEPYRTLRSAIYDGRVKGYPYPTLYHELRRLEDTPQKIDHPQDSSKDLADALCGVVFTLFDAGYGGEPLSPQKGISSFSDDGLVNESFQEVKRTEDGRIIERGVEIEYNEPKTYKKGPKTLAPSYTKVKQDGTVVDVKNGLNAEDYLSRG